MRDRNLRFTHTHQNTSTPEARMLGRPVIWCCKSNGRRADTDSDRARSGWPRLQLVRHYMYISRQRFSVRSSPRYGSNLTPLLRSILSNSLPHPLFSNSTPSSSPSHPAGRPAAAGGAARSGEQRRPWRATGRRPTGPLLAVVATGGGGIFF
uniref:Uncharacterized protein n=1 Tax=Oryza sativa subsp. japonica TaxID=39947 RepID=Q6Z6D3_ORYSJ|nr:hypothetical protein [Oryza sativa Japonica Group]BAD38433.1 hypothetical protein [Oryza sativa Japonica Group]